MQCYQCNVKLEYDLTEIHTGYGCSECHGAWLPAKFLKAIGTVKEFDYMAFVGQVQSQVKETTELTCPSGCGQLHRHFFENSHFSYCHSCFGTWFKQGELKGFLHNFRDARDIRVLDTADRINGLDLLFDLLK